MLEARKYADIGAWRRESFGSYKAAQKCGWLTECRTHMVESPRPPRGKSRTLDECKLDASRFSTRSEWQIKSRTFYDYACRHGWLGDCTTHMQLPVRSNTLRWTLACVLEVASNYPSLVAWNREEPLCSSAARRKGWTSVVAAMFRRIEAGKFSGSLCVSKESLESLAAKWRDRDEEWAIVSPETYIQAAKSGLVSNLSSLNTPKGKTRTMNSSPADS